MDAWEILIGNSNLTPAGSYDAWEHLNAQEGGSGGDITIVFADDLTLELDDDVTLELEDNLLEILIDETEFILIDDTV
jgi:hypothetical protein